MNTKSLSPAARWAGRFLPALLLIPLGAAGQEAIRMSLTSAEAAELRRKAATTLGYYNLKMGPTMWNFAAALDTEFSDNIQLETSSEARADLSFRPRIDTRMLWPVTDQNSLNLTLGGGYAFYVTHSDVNRYFISPGSEVAFDLYVGNLWLSFHDRMSITENTYTDPTVVGTTDYSRLENQLGFTAVWDLNRIVLRSGYDHVNYVNLSSAGASYPDGEAELLFATAGYLLRPQMTTGIELGGGFVSYDREEGAAGFAEAVQLSVGGFYEAQLSEYVKGRLGVGYSSLLPDGGPDQSDENGWYAQGSLNHRVNEYVNYSLAGARQVSFTYYGGTLDLYNVQLRANWSVLREIRLTTAFSYEHGTTLYGVTERFDRYGPGLGLSRPLNERLSAHFNYQFYWRESNLSSGDYTVNIFTLGLRYRF